MSKRIISLITLVFILLLTLFTVSCENLSEPNESTDGEIDFSVTDETKSIDYSKFAGIEINVFNWGEYISDGSEGCVDVNEEFEKLTGIKVNYINYASNEDMYVLLTTPGTSYDIVIPSDYMIQKLIKEKLVQKLDFANIPNYKNILDEYRNLYFDPANEYSVPYNVGIVGLIYNKKLLNYTPDSWSVLWDENLKDQILMFNNPRDAFAIAQFYLGFDINTESTELLTISKDKLTEQKKYVKSYVMDEVFNKMESGAAAVAPYYAGDYLSMYQNNNDLAFAIPKEGSNIFVDSICIPTSSKNKEAAEVYINFLLDKNVALQNAEKICYTTPNKEVANSDEYQEFLSELHPDANNILYPDLKTIYNTDDLEKYYFKNLSDDALRTMNDLWLDLKIASGDESETSALIIVCGIIIVAIAATLIFIKIRKSKRERDED